MGLEKSSTTANAKVVHMTSVHFPFDTRIFHRELSTLVDAGFEVTLIVPYEKDEVRNGIQIRALPRPRNRLVRMLITAPSIFLLALREKGALYQFHDPELIPVGILLSLLGKDVVYDVHEHVPRQIRTKTWIPGFLRPVISHVVDALERFGSRFFSGIIAAWPAIEPRFPRDKTVSVQNFPRREELVVPNSVPYSKRPPNIAYVGGISEIRGIREIIKGVGLVTNTSPVRLLLAGKFMPESLEVAMQLSQYPYVDYLGWQSRSQVASLLGQARMGLVLFHPVPNHVQALPNKLFEYMSAGLPVIASDFPIWREIVEKSGCGLLVDPMDPGAIARAIEFLLDHEDEAQKMGERGRRAVEESFNWETQAENLLELYNRIIVKGR